MNKTNQLFLDYIQGLKEDHLFKFKEETISNVDILKPVKQIKRDLKTEIFHAVSQNNWSEVASIIKEDHKLLGHQLNFSSLGPNWNKVRKETNHPYTTVLNIAIVKRQPEVYSLATQSDFKFIHFNFLFSEYNSIEHNNELIDFVKSITTEKEFLNKAQIHISNYFSGYNMSELKQTFDHMFDFVLQNNLLQQPKEIKIDFLKEESLKSIFQNINSIILDNAFMLPIEKFKDFIKHTHNPNQTYNHMLFLAAIDNNFNKRNNKTIPEKLNTLLKVGMELGFDYSCISLKLKNKAIKVPLPIIVALTSGVQTLGIFEPFQDLMENCKKFLSSSDGKGINLTAKNNSKITKKLLNGLEELGVEWWKIRRNHFIVQHFSDVADCLECLQDSTERKTALDMSSFKAVLETKPELLQHSFVAPYIKNIPEYQKEMITHEKKVLHELQKSIKNIEHKKTSVKVL